MLVVLDESVVVSSQLGFSLILLESTGLELLVGISKSSRGIKDLSVSVCEFGITFNLLCAIDIIMVDLFFIDGSLELIQDFLNGIEGRVGL